MSGFEDLNVTPSRGKLTFSSRPRYFAVSLNCAVWLTRDKLAGAFTERLIGTNVHSPSVRRTLLIICCEIRSIGAEDAALPNDPSVHTSLTLAPVIPVGKLRKIQEPSG